MTKTYQGGGEVRVLLDDEKKQAYIMAGTNEMQEPDAASVTLAWCDSQVAGHFVAIRDEPWGWIQDLVEEYVQYPETVFFAARRGTRSPDRPDDFAVCMAAEMATPEGSYYRIATFSHMRWEDRVECVLEGFVSMAKQRYARDQMVIEAAIARQVAPVVATELHLTKPIIGVGGGGEAASWDLVGPTPRLNEDHSNGIS